MISYIKGDILTSFENEAIDIVVHGCNCYCTMGAGIAKSIKEMYPEAFYIDKKADKLYNDKSVKLGSISFSSVQRRTKRGYIVNAYTQETYWDTKRMLSYDAIESSLFVVSKTFPEHLKIGMPFIGCGLARGNWERVSSIIDDVFKNREIHVYYISEKDYKNNLLGRRKL